MTFLWPAMLYSLILIPLLGALYLMLQRRRKRIAANYQTLSPAPGASRQDPGARRHIPPILFLLSLTILGVGLARPQTEVSLPHIEGTVILAFDVSGSMAADDLKPTRMEAAKAAAKSFVEEQPSTVRIGVVAFSDNGLSVQTPTDDQNAILEAIDRLAPERGTSLSSGIESSLKAIEVGAGQPSEVYTNLTPVPTLTPTPVPPGTYTSADIILLTDGENNENPDPLAAAQAAAERGVRIYTVGIGSAAGTNLHINGFTVHTQLDEDLLKQISLITGGTYYDAQSTQDLIKIYSNLNTQLVVTPQETEITSIFAGAGILLMLIGGMLSLFWFSHLP
ncbi:MAG TPA: VWA domain-containing protein [Anaerolineales bacterium]|nr:VWA domain-containing protein [Anaerolineales bacterium]